MGTIPIDGCTGNAGLEQATLLRFVFVAPRVAPRGMRLDPHGFPEVLPAAALEACHLALSLTVHSDE